MTATTGYTGTINTTTTPWWTLPSQMPSSIESKSFGSSSAGVQRYHWVREGFRDIFGSARGLKISLGQRGVQRYL